MRLVIMLILTLVAAQATSGDRSIKTFDGTSIKRFELKNIEGNVKVTASKANKVEITTDKEIFEGGCVIEMEESDNVIEIEVERESGWFKSEPKCRVHFDVKVPKNVAIELATVSGNQDVSGIEADVEFKAVSGNAKGRGIKGTMSFDAVSGSLDVEGELKALEANVVSGEVTARGLAGRAEVNSVSGSVNLHFARAPNEKIDIDTLSGTANVYFPKGSKIRSESKSFSGDVANELQETAGAKTLVKMNSLSGSLNIKTN